MPSLRCQGIYVDIRDRIQLFQLSDFWSSIPHFGHIGVGLPRWYYKKSEILASMSSVLSKVQHIGGRHMQSQGTVSTLHRIWICSLHRSYFITAAIWPLRVTSPCRPHAQVVHAWLIGDLLSGCLRLIKSFHRFPWSDWIAGDPAATYLNRSSIVRQSDRIYPGDAFFRFPARKSGPQDLRNITEYCTKTERRCRLGGSG